MVREARGRSAVCAEYIDVCGGGLVGVKGRGVEGERALGGRLAMFVSLTSMIALVLIILTIYCIFFSFFFRGARRSVRCMLGGAARRCRSRVRFVRSKTVTVERGDLLSDFFRYSGCSSRRTGGRLMCDVRLFTREGEIGRRCPFIADVCLFGGRSRYIGRRCCTVALDTRGRRRMCCRGVRR